MIKYKNLNGSQNLNVVPKRKLKFLLIITIITLSLAFLYLYIPYRLELAQANLQNESASSQTDQNDNDSYDEVPEEKIFQTEGTKNILFWTRFFNNPDWITGKQDEAGEEILKSVQCPVTNCFFTHNKSHLSDITEFDAIAFHGPEVRRAPLPTVRSPHQMYIFVSLESPTAVLDNLKQYANFYNLTMTYRLDSDIEFDYGKVIDKRTNKIVAPAVNPKWRSPEDDFSDDKILQLFHNKTKPVAWFVSNCFTRSKRNQLVNSIQKLINVDIYGRCGPLKCPVDDQKCLDMLSADYKFYLSFENSLCMDYVTEKLYRPLTQYVIPVVFNGGNTSRFAPPKSYINANDFDTVNDLVQYMKFLIDHPEEYVKYFWWKQYYTIKSHPTYPYMLCDLCKRFNDPSFLKNSQLYSDIDDWFRNRTLCNQTSRIRF